MNFLSVIDFAFMMLLFVFIYSFFRKTDAVKIFIGLLIWFLSYLIIDYIGLSRTAYLMEKGFELMSLGLLVIFHSELRTFLKKIGGIASFKDELPTDELTLEELKKAVFELSKSKTGALIILDDTKTLNLDNGTMINADCSNDLIETIFFKNSPLHDGAIVIRDNKIVSAGVKLPYSGVKRKELGYMGTRHHVALETSINNDVKALVVSEETGGVSVAYNGILTKLNNKRDFNQFFSK